METEMPEDVMEWRTRRRSELLALRETVPAKDRDRWNAAITRLLIDGFPCLAGMIVGFCWPAKGEFDARAATHHFRGRGAQTALPVAAAQDAPLEFRIWTPQTATMPGAFDLPVPQGTPVVRPDALLIPPVGFSSRGYRLGYGGGSFDRTLAAMDPQPLKIGVAFEIGRVRTIYPQPHDVPMDFIVTENGIHEVRDENLVPIREPQKVRAIVARLSRERSGVKRFGGASAGAPLTNGKVVALLNGLLADERAPAISIAAYMDDCEPDSVLWLRLRDMQCEQARNCSVLAELVRGLGGTATEERGGSFHETMARRGEGPRIAFLRDCQATLARTIKAALPRIDDPVVRPELKHMLAAHLRSAEWCELALQARRSRRTAHARTH